MNSKTEPPNSYIRPWIPRLVDALPGNPASVGLSLAALLLVIFIGGRLLSNTGGVSTPGDFRLAVIHILLTAYAVFAYAYLLIAARKATLDLEVVAGHTKQWQQVIATVGKYPWWQLLIAGVVGVLIDIYATNMTTLDSNPWVWQENNYDSSWMRVIGPFFAWSMSSLCYVLVVESARLSRLTDNIESLDLFDLLPYKPLVRQGLTNVLLLVGMVSVLSLFLLEPGFVAFLLQLVTLLAVTAWIGLMLPLRGIRKKISLAKQAELEWCQEALKVARTQLKSGDESQQSIVEITAYKTLIESIRNWPFDNPTLVRFGLYLLIPLVSMFGGAFVERGLDFFLG